MHHHAGGTEKKMKINILSLVVSACIIFPLSGQAYQSLQPHDGKVTILAAKADEQSFFSAGEDGFLVKWKQSGQEESSGERYQISDIPIKLLDLAPAGSDLAVYESDGLSTNRVAVYDWTGYSRRFAKRFKNTVTCLSYSANGSYLFVATATVNGIYILNPKTGDVIKNIRTIPGIITMAKTGTSEKTAIMYSPSGFLYYWDLKKGNIKVRFQAEAALQQPCLFGSGKFQNRFFAGVKDNTIYIIDATNGTTLASYKASNPKICCCEGDYEEGLFYVSDRGKDYSLSLISNDSLESSLTASSSKKSMPSSSLVKHFMGLKSSDSFTAIAKNQESILLGTKNGDLYSFSDIKESETYSLAPLTQGSYRHASDISIDGESFYTLAAGKIFRMDFTQGTTEEIAGAPAGTDSMIARGNAFYLWTKASKAPVYRLSGDTGKSEILFTPGGSITKLRVLEKGILYLQGNSSVVFYDMQAGKNRELYSGTALEDAVLVGQELFIAKSVVNANDSVLMSVNTGTKETVPVKTGGTVAFSLSYGEGKSIYGIEIAAKGNDEYMTQVFSYDSQTKSFRSLLSLNDEDSSASTQLNGDKLYTNIGRTQVYAYNLKTNRSSAFRRSSALPVKAVGNAGLLAVLNQNGSISWYDERSRKAVASWYLSDEGTWQAE